MMEDILARSTRNRFRESFDKKGKKEYVYNVIEKIKIWTLDINNLRC